jgi:hypothetical protein
MVKIHIDKAVPLIWVGNISVEITNFNGPNEKAKNRRNNIMLPSITQPVILKTKHKPVKKERKPHILNQ